MRAFVASVVLGLGAFGLTATQAHASWLSEALNNASFSINIGNPYPAPYVAPIPTYSYSPAIIPAPTCAPAPVVVQPAYVPAYRPVPVYRPIPTPVYRPAPAPLPAYYGPNPWARTNPPQGGWNNDPRRDWRR